MDGSNILQDTVADQAVEAVVNGFKATSSAASVTAETDGSRLIDTMPHEVVGKFAIS
jgi:hypothetical protein